IESLETAVPRCSSRSRSRSNAFRVRCTGRPAAAMVRALASTEMRPNVYFTAENHRSLVNNSHGGTDFVEKSPDLLACIARPERFDRHVSAVAGIADDPDNRGHVRLLLLVAAIEPLLELPRVRVRRQLRNLDVRIAHPQAADVHVQAEP